MSNKQKELRIKLLTFLCFFALFLLLNSYSFVSLAFAEDSSPSANLIKQILQESASKAAQIKKVVDQKLTNKEYSGVVNDKTDSKITLTGKDSSLTVITNEYTDFSSQTKTQKISSGDFIVALGDLNDANELVAKKVIKIPAPKEASVSAYFGKVILKGPTGITVTDKDSKKLNININSDTSYQIGKDTADFSDVSISKTIISVGSKDDNGEISARFIYILLNKTQTTSASPSASPAKTSSGSASKK